MLSVTAGSPEVERARPDRPECFAQELLDLFVTVPCVDAGLPRAVGVTGKSAHGSALSGSLSHSASRLISWS